MYIALCSFRCLQNFFVATTFPCIPAKKEKGVSLYSRPTNLGDFGHWTPELFLGYIYVSWCPNLCNNFFWRSMIFWLKFGWLWLWQWDFAHPTHISFTVLARILSMLVQGISSQFLVAIVGKKKLGHRFQLFKMCICDNQPKKVRTAPSHFFWSYIAGKRTSFQFQLFAVDM